MIKGMRSKVKEGIVKDGKGYVCYHSITACRTESVSKNSSGHYVFKNKTWTKQGINK